MIKETREIKIQKYVLDGGKTYCLYNNKEQETLLAMTYEEDGIKDESKYYSEGVWFEYDNVLDSNSIINERKYKKKINFSKEPEQRGFKLEQSEKFHFSSKMGDIR